MELLEVSGAWGTHPLWEAEEGLRRAKLDTEGEMGTEVKTGAQGRRGRNRTRSGQGWRQGWNSTGTKGDGGRNGVGG